MRPVFRLAADRRHLLALGARISFATFAAATVWPHASASQSGLVGGNADGDGVRLSFVQGGEGDLMLFLHGAPDTWMLYTSQLAEFSQDHMPAPNREIVACGFFAASALPEGTTEGTRRRIGEVLDGAPPITTWR